MRKTSHDVLALILAGAALLAAGAASGQDAGFWPQVLEGDKGSITIYQPQLESFEGDILETRAAVAVSRKGEKQMVFGAVWFRARLLTDRDARTATLAAVEVTAARFPDLEEGQVEAMSSFMEQEIPNWDLVISLDDLVAALDAQEGRAGGSEAFRMDPPEIIYRDSAAVLALIDGDPRFEAVEGADLEYVVNSAFFIVRPKGGRSFYLRGAGYWFTTQDLTGQWRVADDLPAAVAAVSSQIEEEERKQREEMAADAAGMGVEKDADASPPEVVVRTEPAELIYTNGPADMAPVSGTQLLYLRNSESDVLLDIASQEYYVLIAGRWYRSPSLEQGPWRYVDPEDLPADFAAIPADADISGVLASVPGTVEAREAVLDNEIPQTAEVDRKKATVTVTYDGDPEFTSCGEGVAYARNTDKSVLLVDDTYYCCDEAIWFVSKAGPAGPWEVATELPARIQDLPPECPVYNVKYVRIYDHTPEVVYVGYTPGYYGSYVCGPTVIYGTGWYYRPWYGHYYYPRPVTYGFGVHYSPYTGWGFSFGISYGWLSIGVGWARPPYYGMWGAGGYRYGYRHGYMHGYRHGYMHGYRQGAKAAHYPATRRNTGNVYRNRSEGIKRTGADARPANRIPRTSDRRNDLYTDRDGKVYRDRDGSWEQRDKGAWKPGEATRPADRQRPAQGGSQPAARDRPQAQPQQPATRDRPTSQRPQQPAARDRQAPQRDRQQQLDRDRSSRQRSVERQRSAPPRQPQRSAPQRSAPQRGGGARGR